METATAANQPTAEELERLTNAEEGWEKVPAQTNQPETPEPAPAPAAETPATPEPSKAASPIDEITQKLTTETPFKTVDDIIKGYKSSQSEITKYIERVKPYEQLLNDVAADQGLRQFIDQAIQLYRNPQLAQAYQQPSAEPNPANYDFSTIEGLQQFQKDTIAHAQRAAFETVNQRMSGWEQKQQFEQAKLEFKSKYPNENIDDVMKFVQSRNGKWTFEDAYKIANYDKVKEQAYEQARKEITSKMQQAGEAKPESSAPATVQVTPTEIVGHVSRYGLAAANKKWGEQKVTEVLQTFTNENY